MLVAGLSRGGVSWRPYPLWPPRGLPLSSVSALRRDSVFWLFPPVGLTPVAPFLLVGQWALPCFLEGLPLGPGLFFPPLGTLCSPGVCAPSALAGPAMALGYLEGHSVG